MANVRHMLNMPIKLLFLLLCSLLVLGCAQSPRLNHGLVGRLADRGPVALSADNPFLAANLLLSKEMERSPDLKGFIKHRGAPAALAVEYSNFSGINFKLYYPENREYYNLEELDDTWLINGPLPIPRQDMPEVARITREQTEEPKILLPEDDKNFAPFSSTIEESAKIEDQDAKQQETAQALNRIIAQTAKSPAELTPRGDLVHFVTYAGETLALLSRWYTHDVNNAGKIARINKLANPNELKLGDQIVVPAYLLRNKLRLTEEGLKALQQMVWGQSK